MRTIKYFLTALVALFVLNACNKDDEEIIVPKTKLTVNFSTPDGVEITDYESVKIKFTEVNTKITTEEKVLGNTVTVNLRQGKYDISVSGNISYTFNGENKKGSANASLKQIELNKDTEVKNVLLNIGSTQNQVGNQVNNTFLKLNFITSDGIEITDYKDVKVKFKEINTNIETEKKILGKTLDIELRQGSYEISVNGMVTYTFEGNSMESNIGAFESQVTFDKVNETKEIQLSLKSMHNDLIIEEIFFAGTRTPQGASYFGDKYFKIYNNTDKVLYADGLIIAMSAFETTNKKEYSPNIMNEAFTSDAMVKLPGNGKEYPIEPGKSIIITDTAINHKKNNPNSFDLSKADFEFYYEGTDDVDNSNVPNVTNLYDRMVINDQGYRSFVIFRLPEGMTNESYLKDYTYNVEYNEEIPGFGTFPYTDPRMKVPNKWIIDAVNISTETEFQWLVTDPSLDSGWTFCASASHDDIRYGTSIRRKVVEEVNGKRLLLDTNNSSVDFKSRAIPSVSNY